MRTVSPAIAEASGTSVAAGENAGSHAGWSGWSSAARSHTCSRARPRSAGSAACSPRARSPHGTARRSRPLRLFRARARGNGAFCAASGPRLRMVRLPAGGQPERDSARSGTDRYPDRPGLGIEIDAALIADSGFRDGAASRVDKRCAMTNLRMLEEFPEYGNSRGSGRAASRLESRPWREGSQRQDTGWDASACAVQ